MLQASCRLLLPQAGRLKECLFVQMLHPKKKHNSGVIVRHVHKNNIYVVANFLFLLIVIFPLLLGMVMYANKLKTKEK